MSTVSYYNRYPSYKNVQFAADANEDLAIDFDSIKNCISDFNTAMIQADMIRTPDEGQLDINNIKKIKYHSVYGTVVQNTEAFAYDPLIYTFNDALNIDHPLYIKVIFRYMAVYTKSSTIKNNHLILAAKILISKDSDFSTQLLYESTYQISPTTNQNVINETIVDCHTVSNSEIVNEKNSLFINLCPNYTPNSSVNTWALNLSLLTILINRKENGDVLVYGGRGPVSCIFTSTSSVINPYKINTLGDITVAKTGNINATLQVINNTSLTISTMPISDNLSPIIQNSNSSLDGNTYLNPSIYTSDQNYYNYDICCMDRTTTAFLSRNATYKTKLSNDELATYKLIGYPAYPVTFGGDYTTLLLRIE